MAGQAVLNCLGAGCFRTVNAKTEQGKAAQGFKNPDSNGMDNRTDRVKDKFG